MEAQLLILTLGHAISAVFLTCFGIFVFVKNTRKSENILFLALAISIAFFNAYFAIAINIPPSELAYDLWFLNVFDVFIATSYIHFMLRAIDRHIAMRWFIVFSYICAFLILAASFMFPQLFLPEVTEKLYLKSYLNAGPLYSVMLFFFLVFPLIAFFELVQAYFRGGFDRVRSEYYIATSLVGYGLGCLSFPLVYDFQFNPLLGMLVGLYTIPIAYGIVSKQLLDIRLAVKRASFYALGIAVVAVFLVVLILLNNVVIATFPFLQFWTVPLIAAVVGVFIGRAYWLQASENDKLKYEFITIATHKLRTPLTRIRWEISFMEETFKDMPAVIEAVRRIDDANNRLIELTNVLVEASETEDVYYGYKRQYFDIKATVEKALERTKSIVEKKHITLTKHFAENVPLVPGDENRIMSAMEVMIENALVYSNEGSAVEISLTEKNKFITFAVKDSGIGIKPEDQKHMFTKFYRTYAARVADTEGMGLGLAMAKSVIDRHRGEIGVRSEGDGKGSTFWFSIPV